MNRYTVKLLCPLFLIFIVYTTTPSHTIIKFATRITIFATRFIIPQKSFPSFAPLTNECKILFPGDVRFCYNIGTF